MDFFGNQWQSITMESLLLLYPEQASDLSQYEVCRVTKFARYPSVLVVSLAMPGVGKGYRTARTIDVDIGRFLSAWSTIVERAKSSSSPAQEKEVTQDSDRTKE